MKLFLLTGNSKEISEVIPEILENDATFEYAANKKVGRFDKYGHWKLENESKNID